MRQETLKIEPLAMPEFVERHLPQEKLSFKQIRDEYVKYLWQNRHCHHYGSFKNSLEWITEQTRRYKNTL